MTRNNLPTTLITLQNGIRVIHRPVQHSEIVHCGFMIDSGSRDETAANNGVAHFIEHTVFKGTDKRKSHHILRRIEDVGGELNAFTTREKTCYYASCLKGYAGRAVDLLTDITFGSVFPEKELEKEKKVIIEEIDMYDDSPEESIYDDFYAILFGSHSLGFNILGTKETVSSFTRDTILQFTGENYVGSGIVLSIVGDLTVTQVEKLAIRYLEPVQLPPSKVNRRTAPEPSRSFSETREKDFVQTHCIMGSRAFSRHDARRYTLSLINNILGGSGMSSRLNMSVREKHGLVYHIGSHYSSYLDAGVYTIYFAADRKNLKKCRDIIGNELKKMREQPLTERQLHVAKQQFLGQMAMLVENNSIQMQHQARSLLDFGLVHEFPQIMEEVNKITSEQIVEVARAIFDPAGMSTLIYKDEGKS